MIYLKDSKLKVESAKNVARVFQDLLSLEDTISQEKEHFYVMHLDVRSRIKMVELVTVGTLTSSLVASAGDIQTGGYRGSGVHYHRAQLGGGRSIR